MGAKFSQGPVVPELKHLAGWSITKVEGKYTSFRRDADNPFFVTRPDYRRVFDVPKNVDKQFKYFDPERKSRVSAFLIFGAVALMAQARPEQKLIFILSMVDLDFKRFLNRCEICMAMRCASLGLARAKQIDPPSVRRIETMAQAAFTDENTHLNEQGEISVADMSRYCTHEPEMLFYLIDLASTRGADVAQLWRRQKELLLQLSEVEGKLATLGVEVSAMHSDELHQHAAHAVKKAKAAADGALRRELEREIQQRELDEDAAMAAKELEQEARHARMKQRLERSKARRAASKSRPRMLPKTMSAARRRMISKEDLRQEEIDMAVQRMYIAFQELDLDPDGMALLDVAQLMDIVEAAEGPLAMTTAEAQDVLEHCLQNNALGHVGVEELERWYREERMAPKRPPPNAWQSLAWAALDTMKKIQSDFRRTVTALAVRAKAQQSIAGVDVQSGALVGLVDGDGSNMPDGSVVGARAPLDRNRSLLAFSMSVGADPPTEPEKVRGCLRLDLVLEHSQARKQALLDGPKAEVVIAETILPEDQQSAAWVDFSLNEAVTEVEARELGKTLLALLDSPAIKPVLTELGAMQHMVDIISFGHAREGTAAAENGAPPRYLLRASFFSEFDPLQELTEATAGPGMARVNFADLFTKLSVYLETNMSLLDIVSAQANCVNMDDKLYDAKTGQLSTFGEDMAARLFRHFDTDGDGVLCLEEMNAMLRAMGQRSIPGAADPLSDLAGRVQEDEFRAVVEQERAVYIREKHARDEQRAVKRMLAQQMQATGDGSSSSDDSDQEEKKELQTLSDSETDDELAEGSTYGVTLKAFQRSYSRSGGLEHDLGLVGIGGVNEQLSASFTVTSESKASVAHAFEHLLGSNPLVDRFLKKLCWVGRRVNDVYYDGHVGTWVELWDRPQVPGIVLECGGVLKAILSARRVLADGTKGALVALRRWASVAADDEDLTEVTEKASAVLAQKVDHAGKVAESMVQKEKMIKEAEKEMAETIEAARRVRRKKLLEAKRERAALNDQEGEQNGTADAEANPDVALSAGRAVAFYDQMRQRVAGVRAISFGTRELTLRLGVEGFDFCSLLPVGRGEAATELE